MLELQSIENYYSPKKLDKQQGEISQNLILQLQKKETELSQNIERFQPQLEEYIDELINLLTPHKDFFKDKMIHEHDNIEFAHFLDTKLPNLKKRPINLAAIIKEVSDFQHQCTHVQREVAHYLQDFDINLKFKRGSQATDIKNKYDQAISETLTKIKGTLEQLESQLKEQRTEIENLKKEVHKNEPKEALHIQVTTEFQNAIQQIYNEANEAIEKNTLTGKDYTEACGIRGLCRLPYQGNPAKIKEAGLNTLKEIKATSYGGIKLALLQSIHDAHAQNIEAIKNLSDEEIESLYVVKIQQPIIEAPIPEEPPKPDILLKMEEVDNPGQGNCAFYAFAIGLINIIQEEATYHNRTMFERLLVLDKSFKNFNSSNPEVIKYYKEIIDYKIEDPNNDLLNRLQRSLRLIVYNEQLKSLEEVCANPGDDYIQVAANSNFLQFMFLYHRDAYMSDPRFNVFANNEEILAAIEQVRSVVKNNEELLELAPLFIKLIYGYEVDPTKIIPTTLPSDDSPILKSLLSVTNDFFWGTHLDLDFLAHSFNLNLHTLINGQATYNFVDTETLHTVTVNNENNAHWTTQVLFAKAQTLGYFDSDGSNSESKPILESCTPESYTPEANKKETPAITYSDEERAAIFVKIYTALHEAQTTSFKTKNIWVNKKTPPTLQEIAKYAKANKNSRSAEAWKLMENYCKSDDDKKVIKLAKDIHNYGYEHSGFFKSSRYTERNKALFEEGFTNSTSKNTRTDKIREALKDLDAGTKFKP